MPVFITLISYDNGFSLVDRVFRDQKEAQAYVEVMTKDKAAAEMRCRKLVDDLGFGDLGKFVTEGTVNYRIISRNAD